MGFRGKKKSHMTVKKQACLGLFLNRAPFPNPRIEKKEFVQNEHLYDM